MRSELRLRGVGGQGIITMGYVIGRAATLYDRREVCMTEFYGPEITGGFAKTDLIIQDEPIDYPIVDHPDVFVVMSNDAWLADGGSLREGGMVIYDTDFVNMENPTDNMIGIPAMKEALKLGRKVVANVILMGALQEITGVVTKESLEKALLDRVPKGTEELNLSALHKGYELGKGIGGN